jgi:hypothetical protein
MTDRQTERGEQRRDELPPEPQQPEAQEDQRNVTDRHPDERGRDANRSGSDSNA